MVKVKTSDRIAKLVKNRETLKKQIESSKQKISQYEDKLAKELGQLALEHSLDMLNEKQLKSASEKIAKEHNLS
mgnify:CR=1 FL=1